MSSRERLRSPPSIGRWKSQRRESRAKRKQRKLPRPNDHLPTLTTWQHLMMVANITGGDSTQGPGMPPKPVNVKQVLVYLTHEQHAALIKLKEKLGVPVSESIRRAIDRYLKQVEGRK
jgi:hypothetical protein